MIDTVLMKKTEPISIIPLNSFDDLTVYCTKTSEIQFESSNWETWSKQMYSDTDVSQLLALDNKRNMLNFLKTTYLEVVIR